MFDNILLITASYLDPELKNFDFVEELEEKSPADFILLARDYLLKKCSEINLGIVEAEKNSDEVNILRTKDSIEDDLNSFCKPKVAVLIKIKKRGQLKKKFVFKMPSK